MYLSCILCFSHLLFDKHINENKIIPFLVQTNLLNCATVCLYHGPVNPVGPCRARSVYLTTVLLGRLGSLTVNQYSAHSFARN